MSTARSELVTLGGLPWPVLVTVHPTARRLSLRLDTRGHRLKLTCPHSISRRRALEWAQGQRDWVLGQVEKQGAPAYLEPGETIPFDGSPHRLLSISDARRGVELAPGEIRVGGPLDRFAGRLGRWLRAESRRRLTEETLAIAAVHGIDVAGVQVGDAGTRWGSCSHDGRIRFSWRLLLAPPDVRRYVVAHELAHRRHMDHSPAFRAEEKRLFGGDPAPQRLALRRLSADLRRVRLP